MKKQSVLLKLCHNFIMCNFKISKSVSEFLKSRSQISPMLPLLFKILCQLHLLIMKHPFQFILYQFGPSLLSNAILLSSYPHSYHKSSRYLENDLKKIQIFIISGKQLLLISNISLFSIADNIDENVESCITTITMKKNE